MSVAIRQAVDTPMDVTDMFDANSNTRERTWRANLQQAPGTARYHDDAEPPAPVGIVDLQAGGWSFAARDMQGAIWVWGECWATRGSRGHVAHRTIRQAQRRRLRLQHSQLG